MANNLFNREGGEQNGETLFDLVEEAHQKKDFGALAKVLGQLVEKSKQQFYLLEPIVIIANWLAESSELAHLSQSIDACRFAVNKSPSGSEMEEQAVAGILRHVDALAAKDVEKAIDACRFAANNSAPGSEMKKQAVAGFNRHVDALAAKDVEKAIAACRDTYDNSPSGSEMEKQAVAGILRHVDALAAKDVEKAIDACRDAYDKSPSGSEMEKQAEAKLEQLNREQPKRSASLPSEAAVQAFVKKFRTPSPS